MIKSVAILLTLAGLVVATEADAQYVTQRRASGSAITSQPTRVYSYSYYTLSPLPPRTYVGYGAHDFPFHGVPYGHPYDPWTWPMMSGSYGKGLARYYDPPVK